MISSNSILKFKLDHSFGEAYCLLQDYSNNNIPIAVLIKVIDVSDIDVLEYDDILNAPSLINPIRIYEYPNLRGKGAWKLIHNGEEYNVNVPSLPPINKKIPALSLTNYNESKCSPWRTLKYFHEFMSHDGDTEIDYKRVGHLENEYIFYKDEIVTRATMELIKLNGEKIEDYYDILDLKYTWTYLRSINVPFQKDIPDKYKGKIIPNEDIEKYKGIPFRSPLANPKPPQNFPDNPLDLYNS